MVLVEQSEDLVDGDAIGVVTHPDGLGMPRLPGAHLAIGGVGSGSSHESHRSLQHTVSLPEQLFSSPEAPHRQVDRLALLEMTIQSVPEHSMEERHGQDGGVTAGQGVGRESTGLVSAGNVWHGPSKGWGGESGQKCDRSQSMGSAP